MGGGLYRKGSSRSSRHDDRESLKQTKLSHYHDRQRKPRVFISFHIEDEAQVNLLRYQSKNSDQLEFTDYSVKEPFDEKWKTQCAERIKQSSIVVIAIGEETYRRDAVLWEIRKAHELGKPVIGMRIHSDKNHKIPQPMLDHGDKVLPWKLSTLQAELQKN